MQLDVERIFFLDYWKNKKVGSLPNGNIEKAKKYLIEFMDEGLIYIPLPEEELTFLKVDGLKDILRNNKMKVSGKKQELVDRIIENFSFQELSNNVISIYRLTESGKQELKYNRIFLVNKMKNYGFSDIELADKRDGLFDINPAFFDNDIFWSLFNDRLTVSQLKKDWQVYRQTKWHMANILLDDKFYHDAIAYYCTVCFVDLSGMMDNNGIKAFDDVYLHKIVIKKIEEAMSRGSMSVEALKDFFPIALAHYQIRLPFSYFDLDTICQIIIDALNGLDFDEMKSTYKRADCEIVLDNGFKLSLDHNKGLLTREILMAKPKVEIILDEKEEIFFLTLQEKLKMLSVQKELSYERMSDGTLSFRYGRIAVGKVKLKGRKTNMQILKLIPNTLNEVDVSWYYDKPLEVYLSYIDHWISYLEIVTGKDALYKNITEIAKDV